MRSVAIVMAALTLGANALGGSAVADELASSAADATGHAADEQIVPNSPSLESLVVDGEYVDLDAVDDVFAIQGAIDEMIPVVVDGQEDGIGLGGACTANADPPATAGDGINITFGGSYGCNGVQQEMAVEWCLLIKDAGVYRPYACVALGGRSIQSLDATWGFPCSPGWHRYKSRVRGASTGSGGNPHSDRDRAPGSGSPGVRIYCRPSVTEP
jgi:hypothetical protein